MLIRVQSIIELPYAKSLLVNFQPCRSSSETLMAYNRHQQQLTAPCSPMPSRQQARLRKRKPEAVPTLEDSAPTRSIEHASFPIVAIGASAGGLDAYSEFFRALPTDTGMAFVLVQHLDPQHHSMLSGILSKTTKMPVEEVKANVEIRPNRVYVIPPNAFMAVAKGRFVLTPRESDRGRHLSVDHFMRSLAEDRQSGAIGIILSGTGSDGTLGVGAIKAEAGLNFAQDPASAKYDGMPRSAIASGCIDFVLAPGEIAQELERIKRHPYTRQVADLKEETPPAAKDAFQQIIHLLRKNGGVDFGQYKPNTIHRRALRRMAILKYESLAEYAKHLKEHPEEVGNLYDDILINVTSFFRDPEAFEFLKRQIYPAILRTKGDNRSIRMWAPGCSTGEETYSLAITLLEFLGDRAADFQIQLFGTDLNEKGIQKARAGVYSERIVDEVSMERLRRFFVKTDEGYRVVKAVRETCVFARQNLVSDPPFSQMDLVACRNMLIYMGPALQKRIIPILHYALRPAGFLFLGSSESVSAFPALFSPADKKHKIYAKNPVASRLHYDFSQLRSPIEHAQLPASRRAEGQGGAPQELDVQAEADRFILRNHAPVGVVVNGALEVVQFRGRTAPYLEPAPGRPTVNVLKLARQGLARELRTLINGAKKKGLPVHKSNVPFEGDGQKRLLDITVAPLGGGSDANSPDEPFLLILLEAGRSSPATVPESGRKGTSAETARGREIQKLRQELATAQEALHDATESEEATREEFQSANEEILSSNEELQSTNEELETSKEELQSANEELNTLNEELRHRNVELNELSNDISNLLNSTRLPVVMLDGDLRIRRFTPMAEKMLKVAASDIGRPISDLRLNVRMPDLEPAIRQVLESLQPTEREVEDEQNRWYSLQIHPYRTIDNKIDGVVLNLMDIDAIKKSNEQLKRSGAFLRGIVDTVREPLLVLDPDLRVVAANTPFLHSFNLPHEAAVNHFLYELGNEAWNIPDLRTSLETLLERKSQITDLQVEHDFPHIGRRTMLINARTLVQADDVPPLIFAAIEDVTDRKLAEAALIKSEKLAVAGSMAASLAHEINNPLQGITNFFALLEVSDGICGEDRVRLLEANKLLSRVTYLTRQSLSFYRETKSPVEVNVAEVLDGVLEFHSERLRENGINITKQYLLDGTSLNFPDEIRQVCATLIGNAIDSLNSTGAIAIRASRSHSWKGALACGLRITVADNGSGMSPATRQRIFDPFFTTKGKKGVGLGLWITHAIVQRLGGTIRVRSKPQSGTSFSVFLPDQTPIR